MTDKYKAQAAYAARKGQKTFGYKIDAATGEAFRDVCQKRGVAQARVLEELMKNFIKQ